MAARVKVIIDGLKVVVDVEGVSGKKCMDLTDFLTLGTGAKITEQQIKTEYNDLEVPVEVRV